VGEFTPFLLLAGLVFLTVRRWITPPLALFLASVWLTAAGVGGVLSFGALLSLGLVALWFELQEILLVSAPLPGPAAQDAAFHGLVGGVVGGLGLSLVAGVPGAAVAIGFLGAMAAGLAEGSGVAPAALAALNLPGAGTRSGLVNGLLALAVVLEMVVGRLS